jgi:hypothetical protein
MCSNYFLAKAKCYYLIQKFLDLKENGLIMNFVSKTNIFNFLGTLLGKRKQTIFKKFWFDIIK